MYDDREDRDDRRESSSHCHLSFLAIERTPSPSDALGIKIPPRVCGACTVHAECTYIIERGGKQLSYNSWLLIMDGIVDGTIGYSLG